MAMSVHTPDGENSFPTAVVWHIDDDGYLHLSESVEFVNRVKSEQKPKTRPLASFAPGCWASVRIERPAAGPFAAND